ncbi:unnamed protein product [Amoebophrya sp. A120]|nr:unnamed protein product [Amoebophrya sp. A120]|eukprot:GSA120T00008258001.1
MVISDQLAEELGTKITTDFAHRKTVKQRRELVSKVLGPKDEETGKFPDKEVRKLAVILVQIAVYTGSLDKFQSLKRDDKMSMKKIVNKMVNNKKDGGFPKLCNTLFESGPPLPPIVWKLREAPKPVGFMAKMANKQSLSKQCSQSLLKSGSTASLGDLVVSAAAGDMAKKLERRQSQEQGSLLGGGADEQVGARPASPSAGGALGSS